MNQAKNKSDWSELDVPLSVMSAVSEHDAKTEDGKSMKMFIVHAYSTNISSEAYEVAKVAYTAEGLVGLKRTIEKTMAERPESFL